MRIVILGQKGGSLPGGGLTIKISETDEETSATSIDTFLTAYPTITVKINNKALRTALEKQEAITVRVDLDPIHGSIKAKVQ